MPRNNSGTYTLPIGAFAPGGLIKSADHNSNYSDIATALTQSLATTGVATMSGPILAASGTVSAPAISWGTDPTTGFYLAGTHQIGLATNGTQVATFNSDQTVTWAGAQTFGTLTASTAFTASGTAALNGGTTLGAAGTLTINSPTVTWGAGAAAAFVATQGLNATIAGILDGGGIALVANNRIFIEVPFACTIKRWTLLADQSGTVTVDIWNVAYGSFPPSSANKITASAPPSLSSAQNNQNTTLVGWTTTLAAGSILAFNVTSNATNCQRVTLSLLVTRTNL